MSAGALAILAALGLAAADAPAPSGASGATASTATIRVGSKAFTEGVVLGELATQSIAASGAVVEHKRQLGGTRLVHTALKHGDIDVYAEYTGTLRQEIYAGIGDDDKALDAALAKDGLARTGSLGFNDTYGLVMRADRAAQLGIARLSDLRAHPELNIGVSNEFLERKDGWPALVHKYELASPHVRGLDHDVAYQALASGGVDVTDCYTTDAEIEALHLRVLVDDRALFPRYDAVYLYRLAIADRVAPALSALAGTIDEATMSSLNARVRVSHESEASVAHAFLVARGVVPASANASASGSDTRAARLFVRTREHIALTGAALAFSVVIGVPLGVLAARRRRAGQGILGVTGILQTIPSLALLVLFVPLVGIGSTPAVMAMVLYGLLPIVRNTYGGLTGIAPHLQDSARALGLSDGARLFRVELPLASPSILAGIQTSATISVGTATIGALIGAGGYGQSILTGIRLDDTALILEGAIPAALLAIALQLAFLVLERFVVPRGLRANAR